MAACSLCLEPARITKKAAITEITKNAVKILRIENFIFDAKRNND